MPRADGKVLDMISYGLMLLFGILFLLSGYIIFRMLHDPLRVNGNPVSRNKHIIISGVLTWSGIVFMGLTEYTRQNVSLDFVGILAIIGFVFVVISMGQLFFWQFLLSKAQDMQGVDQSSKTKQDEPTETTE